MTEIMVRCGIFGYSDDNWVLAPSLPALQDILNTCEEFAAKHNLKFSTDPNPKKCKTKCMAFLKKARQLPNMFLCGNPLPWVDNLVHLGVRITNEIDGCLKDADVKRGRYVQKCNNLCQEFTFAHPYTKMKINSIYNCSTYGSQLWDLFGRGVQRLESTYNRSVRVMAGLPLNTHRYFIEPVSGNQHLKIKLISDYLNFIGKVKKSKKRVLNVLYSESCRDTRTVTGRNLRNIMLLTSETDVANLCPDIVKDLKYFEPSENEKFKVDAVLELFEVLYGDLLMDDSWSQDDIECLLRSICTS